MLTFQIDYTETDTSGLWMCDDDYSPYGVMTFEAPNLQVAHTYVEAYQRIDASTWSDQHTILHGDIKRVPTPVTCEWFVSWDDIQDDRYLCEEMLLVPPQSTAVA